MKRSGFEADHLPSSSAKVKGDCSYYSTPLCLYDQHTLFIIFVIAVEVRVLFTQGSYIWRASNTGHTVFSRHALAGQFLYTFNHACVL